MRIPDPRDHQNRNGTYNGVTFFSEMTGLSQDELTWTWKRLQELMNGQKMPKEDALAIVRREQKSRPWEVRQ